MYSLRQLSCRALNYRKTARQFSAASAGSSGPKEYKVVLDNETLYINQELAEGLGWKPEQGAESIPLTLAGWSPEYFAITRSGTDSDLLARGTVESSRNPNLKWVLDYLKER